ncbi:MAG TPA: type II secretion system F family protein [Sedimentisphaerales bacterium]|nr:type II secretion system F family protein [Sedimentisphaerales bacterium]
MKDFRYIARDMEGKQSEGLLQAASKEDVLMWLRNQDLTPVEIDMVAARRRGVRRRPRSDDLAAFCWQLSTMLEGGVPITEALDIIRDDLENIFLREALVSISNEIKAGETLSGAMAKHSKIFDKLFQAMIIAGEASGTLVTVLQRLAAHFDERDRLIKKVKHAMAYPLFVFGFVTLILIAMMTFVIPRFKSIFESIGAGELPAFTRVFMGVYDTIMGNFLLVAIFIVLLVVTLTAYTRTANGHRNLSQAMLRIPLVGSIIINAFVAIFCRTMATLLSSGVSVLEALEILAGTTNNEIISDAVLNTREQITQGSSISVSMAANRFFPNLVVKMTQVGEESGALPSVLEKVSVYYERKVDMTISTLITVLEPLMIVVVGGLVLIMTLALYLPIFTMSDV